MLRFLYLLGDFTPLTMTTVDGWEFRKGNEDRESLGPAFINAHYIHSINPNTKVIVILRDPVER